MRLEEVDYQTLDINDDIIEDYEYVICFADLEFSSKHIHTVKVFLTIEKHNGKVDNISEINTDLVDFWMDLVIKIESKVVYNKEEKYITVPFYRYNKGRMLMILSIIRFLWEESVDLNTIPQMTKNILDVYPNLDPLKAILMAASNVHSTTTNHHNIVNCLCIELKGIWHYRRFKNDSVFSFTNSTSSYKCASVGVKEKLSKEYPKRDKFDIAPILHYYSSQLKKERICETGLKIHGKYLKK